MNPRLAGLLGLLVTLLTPIVLVLLGLRVLLTPLTPRIEYRMPGFPADDFGFSLQDRLRWSSYSLTYLLNSPDRVSWPLALRRRLARVQRARTLTYARCQGRGPGRAEGVYVSLALMIGLGMYAWLGGWKRPSWTVCGGVAG